MSAFPSRPALPEPPHTPAPTHVLREAYCGRHSLPRTLSASQRVRAVGLARGCLMATSSRVLLLFRAKPLPRDLIVAVARIGIHPDGGWECAWTEAPTLARVWLLPPRLRLPVLVRLRLGRRGLRALLRTHDPSLIAWSLQRTSSWPRVLGRVIDRNPDPHIGTLHECRVPDITARLLVVQCPSTGLQHVLVVPREAGRTAAEARRWTFHGLDPAVET